jgi:hypothetical protein
MDKPAQRPSTEIARPVELQGAFTVDLAPAHCDEPEAAETLQEEEGGRKRESAQTNDAAAAKFLEAAFDLEPGAMLYGSTCNSVAALFKCIAKLSAEGKTPEGGICLSDFVAHRGDNGASAAAAVNALLSEVRQFSRREGMWNAENATEADLAKWNSVIFLFGHRAKANNSFSQFYQEALDLIRQGELDPARTEDGARSSAAEIVRTALSIEKSARAIFDNAYASTAGIGSGDPSETKITLFDHLGEAVRQAIIARLVVSLLCKQHNSRLISPLKRIAVLLQTEAKKVASDYPEIDVRKAAIAFSGAIKAAFKEKKGEVNDLWANHFADIEVAIAKCDAAYENYALESGASKKKLSDQTAPASWRSS